MLDSDLDGALMDHRDGDRSDANTIARCRALLGEDAEQLSDDEIDRIRRHADAIAHVIVDLYLEQRSVPA